jgi:hypothetical protein
VPTIHGSAAQVGEGYGLAAGQRVVGSEQDIQRFDVELLGVEAGIRQRRR